MKQRKKRTRPSAGIIAVVGGAVLIAGWVVMRPAPAPEHAHAATASTTAPAASPRISAADAGAWAANGSVTIIDVRDIDSYLAGHVAGALHIPLSRLEGELPYLERGKPIVTYCT